MSEDTRAKTRINGVKINNASTPNMLSKISNTVFIKIMLPSMVLAGASITPMIPENLEFEYAYQYPVVDYQEILIPAQISSTTGKNVAEVKNPQPKFADTNRDGLVSVAVHANKNGEKVYTQIDEKRYADMGKINGVQQNPTKEELVSLWEALQPDIAEAAVARTASSTPQYAAATSLTYAHTTVAGSDTLFITGVVSLGGNTVTGVTFNSDALSKLKQTGNTSGEYEVYIWGLATPDVGTYNVVVTRSSSNFIYSGSTSYSGASQTGIPDAYGDGEPLESTGTSESCAVTTIADNSAVYGFFLADNSGITAGANTYLISKNSGNTVGQFEPTTFLKTPAGAVTLNVTHPTGWHTSACISIAPASTGATSYTTGISGIDFY